MPTITGTPIASPTPPATVEEPEGVRRLRELADLAASGGTTGISEASIMALLRHRNRDTTGQITSIMGRMEVRTALAEELTGIMNQLLELKRLAARGSDDRLSAGEDAGAVAEKLATAQEALARFGITLASTEEGARHDDIYTGEAIDVAMKQVENELKQVNQGNDLDMIELQSLMQQRTSDMQLASNLLKAMNESTGTIIGNMR